jgi:hypothetical protein
MNSKLKRLTEGFKRKVNRDGGLETGSLRFDFGEDGCVLIDGGRFPNHVSNNKSRPAHCTVFTSLETIENMVMGKLDGVGAIRDGHLTVTGDLKKVMAFGPIGKLVPPTDRLIKEDLWFPLGYASRDPKALKRGSTKGRRRKKSD